jgi:hypothetical protein
MTDCKTTIVVQDAGGDLRSYAAPLSPTYTLQDVAHGYDLTFVYYQTYHNSTEGSDEQVVVGVAPSKCRHSNDDVEVLMSSTCPTIPQFVMYTLTNSVGSLDLEPEDLLLQLAAYPDFFPFNVRPQEPGYGSEPELHMETNIG